MAKTNNSKYFNFPIDMLSGFMINPLETLTNILDYAVIVRFNKSHGTKPQRFDALERYFCLKLGDRNRTYENGNKLFETYENSKSVIVGLNTKTFWDYYQSETGVLNEKSEFDKICFLAHLALKSILQQKPYCKVTNLYWLSRMEGRNKSVKHKDELSGIIKKYANEYQTKKIKNELVNNWHLTTYSYFTRGFYISYKLSLDELAYQAESRRKSTILKQQKIESQNARIKAMKRLGRH